MALLSVGWIMGWTIYLIMDGMQGGLSTRGDWIAVPILLFAPPPLRCGFSGRPRYGLCAGSANEPVGHRPSAHTLRRVPKGARVRSGTMG